MAFAYLKMTQHDQALLTPRPLVWWTGNRFDWVFFSCSFPDIVMCRSRSCELNCKSHVIWAELTSITFFSRLSANSQETAEHILKWGGHTKCKYSEVGGLPREILKSSPVKWLEMHSKVWKCHLFVVWKGYVRKQTNKNRRFSGQKKANAFCTFAPYEFLGTRSYKIVTFCGAGPQTTFRMLGFVLFCTVHIGVDRRWEQIRIWNTKK